MSHAVTDAVEDDLRAELRVVEKLIDDVDQLSADARDCDIVAPKVKDCLDVAWWFLEESRAEAWGSLSCGHEPPKLGRSRKPYCANCAHFAELINKAAYLRRVL